MELGQIGVVDQSRELPANKIIVLDGKVQRVDQWTLWNGTPWMTIQIGRENNEIAIRNEGEFYSHIGDPEHGGGSLRGTLAEVLAGLNPTIQEFYTTLFNLENADRETIKASGFKSYIVVEMKSS